MLALDDVTVLDLSRVLAGPFASMLLGDFGARVVKIEKPAGDDTRRFGPPFAAGEAAYFLSVNRNKRSLVVDLGTPAGRLLVRRLAGRADVLLENFRPGTMERLNLSADALCAENPRLVYASISGYGQSGLPEWTRRPGYDVVLQGVGGAMGLTGPPDGVPFKSGTSIADLAAGLFCTIGILVALHARTRTGRGQRVDVSMQDAQIALLTYHAQSHLLGFPVRRMGNAHANVAPYDAFRGEDGWFNLAVATDAQWQALARRVLGRADLAADPRFASNPARVEHRAALSTLLAPLFQARPVAHWVTAIDEAGVPVGPILSVAEALAHPQVRARDMVVDVSHPVLGALPTVGVPVKLSDTPGAVREAPPLLGEHGRAILRDAGLGDEDIAALVAAGAVTLR